MGHRLWALFAEFAQLSFLAIGGASATLAPLHQYLVETTGWVSNEQFYALYAIAQAAPGPNVQFVILFGWQAAGWAGAIMSTLGMCGPPSMLAGVVEAASTLRATDTWVRLINAGLAPMSIGLLLANGWLLSASTASSWKNFALTLLVVLASLRLRLHPLSLIAFGAAAGVTGLLGP